MYGIGMMKKEKLNPFYGNVHFIIHEIKEKFIFDCHPLFQQNIASKSSVSVFLECVLWRADGSQSFLQIYELK